MIIRRGGRPERRAPKGGVWKIAYADFMTAMMAFFLVMWLINAPSEGTKRRRQLFQPDQAVRRQATAAQGHCGPEDVELFGHQSGGKAGRPTGNRGRAREAPGSQRPRCIEAALSGPAHPRDRGSGRCRRQRASVEKATARFSGTRCSVTLMQFSRRSRPRRTASRRWLAAPAPKTRPAELTAPRARAMATSSTRPPGTRPPHRPRPRANRPRRSAPRRRAPTRRRSARCATGPRRRIRQA